jgi:hypothetical protein
LEEDQIRICDGQGGFFDKVYVLQSSTACIREGNIRGTQLHVMEQTKYKVGAP